MCSRLLHKMENYQGDLTDILRAGSGAATTPPAQQDVPAATAMITDEWQFTAQEALDEFGDPFSNMRDPLLHQLDIPPGTGSAFFTSSTSKTSSAGSFAGGCGCGGGGEGGGGNSTMLITQRITDGGPEIIKGQTCNNNNNDRSNKNNSNIFSTMLQVQIPPNAKLLVSPRDSSQVQVVVAAAASPLGSTNDLISIGPPASNSKGNGLVVENGGAQQISSPRNTGMKRRKSQAKKVVCIPAPAPANSRPSGEIVPSDLWAWRKYGQKPIKGSPYPRGYYRCSSSKGCSARKQVERSRTDPNMLVITYTSEHNHPWPTQRNALAGSTRNQPTKTGSTSKASSLSQSQAQKSLKEEEKERGTDHSALSPMASMKEETMDYNDHDHNMEMDHQDVRFSEAFQQTYRPALPESSHAEDFFADLGELEADPINLLFQQGYSGDEQPENKSLDPFSFYDWVHSTTTATTAAATTVTASVEEVNKGL